MYVVERRIARRYVTESVVEIWIPRKGVLGRARNAELPASDMSMFGASVMAHKNEKMQKGQVIEVSIAGQKTTAIVRSERVTRDDKDVSNYGLEFVKPSDGFLAEVRSIVEECRRLANEELYSEQLWLRSR